MIVASYRFTRALNSLATFVTTNSASTDALNALEVWQSAAGMTRAYEKLNDNPGELVARLSWQDSDSQSGPDLQVATEKFGVQRIFISQE